MIEFAIALCFYSMIAILLNSALNALIMSPINEIEQIDLSLLQIKQRLNYAYNYRYSENKFYFNYLKTERYFEFHNKRLVIRNGYEIAIEGIDEFLVDESDNQYSLCLIRQGVRRCIDVKKK